MRHTKSASGHLVGITVSGGLAALVAFWGTLEWAAATPVVNGEGFGALNLLILPAAGFLLGVALAVVLFLPVLLACRTIQRHTGLASIPAVIFGAITVAIVLASTSWILSARAPFIPRVVFTAGVVTSIAAFTAYASALAVTAPIVRPRQGPGAA